MGPKAATESIETVEVREPVDITDMQESEEDTSEAEADSQITSEAPATSEAPKTTEEDNEIKQETPRFRFGRPIRTRTTTKQPAVKISAKDRKVLLKKLFGSRSRSR